MQQNNIHVYKKETSRQKERKEKKKWIVFVSSE